MKIISDSTKEDKRHNKKTASTCDEWMRFNENKVQNVFFFFMILKCLDWHFLNVDLAEMTKGRSYVHVALLHKNDMNQSSYCHIFDRKNKREKHFYAACHKCLWCVTSHFSARMGLRYEKLRILHFVRNLPIAWYIECHPPIHKNQTKFFWKFVQLRAFWMINSYLGPVHTSRDSLLEKKYCKIKLRMFDLLGKLFNNLRKCSEIEVIRIKSIISFAFHIHIPHSTIQNPHSKLQNANSFDVKQKIPIRCTEKEEKIEQCIERHKTKEKTYKKRLIVCDSPMDRCTSLYQLKKKMLLILLLELSKFTESLVLFCRRTVYFFSPIVCSARKVKTMEFGWNRKGSRDERWWWKHIKEWFEKKKKNTQQNQNIKYIIVYAVCGCGWNVHRFRVNEYLRRLYYTNCAILI